MCKLSKRASRSPEGRRSDSTPSIGKSRFPPGKLQSEPNVGRPSLPKEVGLTGLTGKEASVGCGVKPASLVGELAAGTEELSVKSAFEVGGFEKVQPGEPLASDMTKSPAAAEMEELPVNPASAIGSFEKVWPAEPVAGDETAVGTEELPDEELPEDVANKEVVPLVTVGFPDRISRAKASFVSAPNIEGFSAHDYKGGAPCSLPPTKLGRGNQAETSQRSVSRHRSSIPFY
jgi:hypothetical protein